MIRTALVTGSSNGIGKAIAIRLAGDGFFVYITYNTDKDGADDTLAHIHSSGGQGAILHLNVQVEESVLSAIEAIKGRHNLLNVLVNNAAIQVPKAIEDLNYQEWESVVSTRLNGSFLCTKISLPLLKATGSSNIVFITSSLAERPKPTSLAYSVGVAGTIAMMKALAVDLGKYGIRTNAVSPGATQTKMWETLGGDEPHLWKAIAERNPLGRVCKPEDVAEVVSCIVRDRSSYLNGNVIYVNGGSHLI